MPAIAKGSSMIYNISRHAGRRRPGSPIRLASMAANQKRETSSLPYARVKLIFLIATYILIHGRMIITVAATSSHRHRIEQQHRHHSDQLKHKQFRFFFHDTLNATDFIIVDGLPGGNTPTASTFGTVFCLSDPVTEGANASSNPVGTFTGLSVAASLDGLTFFNSLVLSLDAGAYQGTLSLVGVVNSLRPSPLPIVGGTHSFLFAQGTATITPVKIATFNLTYRLDLDVFWPPYIKL